jgi:hypothetical protein
MEPLKERGVWLQLVHGCGTLEQADLGQDLKLLALLVEVDESVLGGVWIGRVHHVEVGEERAQVGNCALRYRRL